jgi:hypothetical protein
MCRKGELTRGMIVVDRRLKAREEQGRIRGVGTDTHSNGPAPVKVDSAEQAKEALHLPGEQGVEVVVTTPGSDDLSQALMRRVWGVKT